MIAQNRFDMGILLCAGRFSTQAFGGAWDWSGARELASRHRLLLSGGLRPQTVRQGIETLRPWGVDVSSGVESRPGVKDLGLLERFVEAVREVDG